MFKTTCACVVAIAALMFTGCGKSPDDGKKPGTGGATVVYGRGADSKKLDPQAIEDGESVNVVTQIFDTLVAFEDRSTKVEPALATSWTSSADGKTWTFTLRPNVVFHDGTPCDAAAVVSNMRRLIDKNAPNRHGLAEVPYGFLYENITGVQVVDGKVAFTLTGPNATFLTNLAMFPACISSPTAMDKWKQDYGQHPVGTGPFKFSSWSPGEKIVLEANPGYWGGAPKPGKVVFAVVPENSVRLQRLRAGELHIIDGVSPIDNASISSDASLRLLSEPGMNVSYLAINTEHAPWDKPEIRRAIAMALDKKELIALAYSGVGTPAVNPLPPTIWGFNESVKDYPYDAAAAKKVLADAGLSGKDVELYVMPNPRAYVPDPGNVGAVVKQRLEAIGLKPHLKSPPWEGGVYLKELKEGRHDIALVGWITDNGDPDNFLYTLFHSKGIPDQNYARYRSAEFDDLVARAQIETDVAKRTELYRKAQETIHSDCPVIPLAYLPNVAATRADVAGYQLHPMGLVRLRNVTIGGK